MKKIFLISFLLASILSFGQHSGYTKQNLKMQWIAGAFDSTLHIPTGSGAPSGLRTGAWTGSGAVYVDTTNNVLYFYSGGSWRNSGSATAYVDSLYNSNDSLIYVKNGNAFYIGNLSNTTVVSNQGNHVLSGMVVSYISGLTYHVGPGYYMIEQVVYHFTGGDVTLDAADGSDARLDLIYIDNTMTLGTIDGTPGETTVTPIEDATTQLGLTTALVAALATNPSNIIDTVIRDEGSAGEWTISKTMTTNDSYGTNPYHGSISQRITGASTGQYIEWIAGSVQSKLRYTNLVFYIRNNSALSSARTFRIGLYNGTTSIGNVLNASLYGYDRAVTGTYMVVAFPMGDFGGADAFDRVRLQNTGLGGTVDVQVDYIRLQANGANNVGSSGVTNITATNNYAQTWTISNPTTTPNLSLVQDTTLIGTRAWIKKGIDSVIGVINSRGIDDVLGVGQSLTSSRTISANDKYLSITGGLKSGNGIFRVTNDSIAGAIQANSMNGTAISGGSENSIGVWGSSLNLFGVFGWSTNNSGVFSLTDSRTIASAIIKSENQDSSKISFPLQVISTPTNISIPGNGTGIKYKNILRGNGFGFDAGSLSFVTSDTNYLSHHTFFDIIGDSAITQTKFARFKEGGLVLVNNLNDTLATKAYARSVGGGSTSLAGLTTDVNISSPSNLQLLQYQTGDNKWHNWTPNYLSSVDTTNISNFSVKVRSLLSATAPITYNSGTGAIGISQATTSTNGYLSSTDWSTFNGKVSPTTSGDIEITDYTKGIILRTSDGTRARITLTKDGSGNLQLTITAL